MSHFDERFFLTFNLSSVILLLQGGDYIYALIFIIFSLLISYNLISIYYVQKKSKNINFNSNNLFKERFYFLRNYLSKIFQYLSNSGYPYGLTVKRYIIIKYILSVILFIISIINTSNIFISLIVLLILYFLPNILVELSLKAESIKIINDISNIVQNIVLSLSANMLLYDSLKNSVDNIENKRFKKEYSIFVNNYRMYNFNIIKAVDEFSQKFSFYEFNMFLSLLIQGEKEGNLLELLESFIENLDITYFKYLKYKSTQRLVVIIFTTFISIVNSFLIVLYPIVIQVSQSFTDIFK